MRVLNGLSCWFSFALGSFSSSKRNSGPAEGDGRRSIRRLHRDRSFASRQPAPRGPGFAAPMLPADAPRWPGMQDAELFLSIAEIASVFVGFGALIALRSGASDPYEVAPVRMVVS